jgi:predicted nuclease of predicted toxin-antitoxin system
VKLLFDENLSPRLIDRLSDLYPASAHVHQCQLGSADDAAIWEYAKSTGFALVSKDSDFAERSVLLGAPPKIIWIRSGNCSSTEIAVLLRTAFASVRHFIQEAEETTLILRHGRANK